MVTEMPQSILGMDVAEMQELMGGGQPGFRARQLYHAIYRNGASRWVEILTLPAALRQQLGEQHTLGLPEIARVYQSADGTRRYLLQLEDGKTVETVWMPEDGRHTICISSQVGC